MSDEDKVIIGNGVPKYMVSLTNHFKYKNFDLTLFFRGKLGFDLLNTKEMYFGNINWSPNNMLRTVLSKHAQLKESPQYSDYYLEPGGFVKLDNVTLGYNVKIKTSYIKNLYLYVTGKISSHLRSTAVLILNWKIQVLQPASIPAVFIQEQNHWQPGYA